MPAFRLARHFSIVSATAIFVAVAALMVFFHHLSVEDMIRLGERQNTILARILIHDIRAIDEDASTWVGDPGPRRTGPLAERLASRVRDLDVLRVGVLDLEGRMALFVPAASGEPRRTGPQFNAARAGTMASRRTVGGAKTSPGLPVGRDVLSTYICPCAVKPVP